MRDPHLCPQWLELGRCSYKNCHLKASHTAANSPRYRKYQQGENFDFSNGAVESAHTVDPSVRQMVLGTPDKTRQPASPVVMRAPRANALEVCVCETAPQFSETPYCLSPMSHFVSLGCLVPRQIKDVPANA